jgi:hypothetical protein
MGNTPYSKTKPFREIAIAAQANNPKNTGTFPSLHVHTFQRIH